MPEGLTYIDLQHFIGVKLCLIIFVVFGIWGMYKKYKPVYFLSLFGITLSASYYIFVKDLGLMFWGLKGDEITIAAMYQKFAHGGFWSDFSYSHLPPFYPPLFFWIGAVFGRFLDWNGIQMAKFMSFATMLIFPLFFYLVQKLYWSNTTKTQYAPGRIAWMIGAILLFIVIDDDAIITKPYELISASLTILWTAFLLRDSYYGNWNFKKIMLYGMSGGILFMLFYFWFFLAAIGVGVFHLFTKFEGRLKSWAHYLGVGLLTLLISSPFWFPLALSYTRLGSENWQAGYFLLSGISVEEIQISFGVSSLVFLIGFVCLLAYRQRSYIRALLSLFASSYIWQVMGMLTILIMASPIQESKGFYFFNRSILALACAYGLERLWLRLKDKGYAQLWLKPAMMLGIVIVASEVFFGTFSDIEIVQQMRKEARAPRNEIVHLVDYLSLYDLDKTITLHSGITELYAFLPVNDFLYYNMNNSHPAAGFSERMLVVEDMARAQSSQELCAIVRNNPIVPIDRIILFKRYGGNAYLLYYHVDNFPQVNAEKTVAIPKQLFDSSEFETVYESDEFIVFEPRCDM